MRGVEIRGYRMCRQWHALVDILPVVFAEARNRQRLDLFAISDELAFRVIFQLLISWAVQRRDFAGIYSVELARERLYARGARLYFYGRG